MRKNIKSVMQKIRKAEAEMAYANPKRASKLTEKIVKWKMQVFDEP